MKKSEFNNAISKYLEAHKELVSVWNQLDWDDQLTARNQSVIERNYPFVKSFDDLLPDVQNWADDVRNNLADGYINTPPIDNLEDAKKFIAECVDYIGTGFNPDTSFAHYVNLNTLETMYNEDSAKEAEERLSAALEFFDMADEDIYKYVISLF